MRAINIKKPAGQAIQLHLSSDIEKPIPCEGEALIKVKYFSLGDLDVGRELATPKLGLEFSGTVEQVVKDDKNNNNNVFNIGDDVLGIAYGRAYAEYIVTSTRTLIHKPPSLSWESAASVPYTWMAATRAIFEAGGFGPTKSILWHGGASAICIAGIQMSAAHSNSATYAIANTPEEATLCRRLGATEAWNYFEDDWAGHLRRATDGKGVDIVVDFAGHGNTQKNIDSIADDGRLVIAGMLSGGGLDGGLDLQEIVDRHIRIEGSQLDALDLDDLEQVVHHFEKEALPKLMDGSFRASIESVFDWEEVQEAQELAEAKSVKGKVVCRVI